MLLSAKKIIGLPAETKNGEKIGKVADINLNAESHTINSYIIAAKSGFIREKNLIVGKNQVISIDDNKMIVEDGLIRENLKSNAIENIAPKAEPALSAASK